MKLDFSFFFHDLSFTPQIRRGNVSAPVMQVDDNYEPPEYPKSDLEKAGIQEALPYFFAFKVWSPFFGLR